MVWTVKQLDAALDVVREEGPQVVMRGEQEFVVGTSLQWETGRAHPVDFAELWSSGSEEAAEEVPWVDFGPEVSMKELARAREGKNAWERLRCAPEPGDPEVQFGRSREDKPAVSFD